MTAWYNEIDPYAAQWLRNLIAAGHIADGVVDERSIADVQADDLAGYTQCHFFAGLGGWSLALQLARWPDDREVWTGSCPCQPFSVAGRQKGFADARHLWPEFRRLIAERRPAVVFGEQVASAAAWLTGVRSDLEALGYAVGAAPIEAASVGAPHKRDRYWFVADDEERRRCRKPSSLPSACKPEGTSGGRGGGGAVENSQGERLEGRPLPGKRIGPPNVGPFPARSGQLRSVGDPGACAFHRQSLAHPPSEGRRQAGCDASGDMEADCSWPGDWNGDGGPTYVVGADGKARRVEPGIRLLAHGIPARVAKLRALGNAIVPQVGAAFVQAYLDCQPDRHLRLAGGVFA